MLVSGAGKHAEERGKRERLENPNGNAHKFTFLGYCGAIMKSFPRGLSRELWLMEERQTEVTGII